MNTDTKNKWKLSTTDHIGRIARDRWPDGSVMWVCAKCLTAEVQGDKGEGLNFCVSYHPEFGWDTENWIEPLDELPEFDDSVYDSLFASFGGEIEIEA